MDATQLNVDPVTTSDEEISQPTMMVLHTNRHLYPSPDVYPNELLMIFPTLNNYILSFVLSTSFSILMEWLSLAASTALYKKTTKVVTF